MKKNLTIFMCRMAITFLLFCSFKVNAQIVISQYYEGTGTNKWIELTNLGNNAVNTASPQLKLALWSVTGSSGNIAFTGAATNTFNLTVTIPAKGSVLIGTTSNGTEVPYLTAASANETANSVINFNGNDGVALLDASNTIIDKFGEGINATDVSYVRSTGITAPNATFTLGEWVSTVLNTVQTAALATSPRLGYQLPPLCVTPATQPTAFIFSSVTNNSINATFTAATGADGYVVVRSTNSTLSTSPVDASSYLVGNSLGGGTVVSSGTSVSFTNTGLNSNTTYYFFAFSYKSSNCSNGPKYLISNPLTASQATPYPPCVTSSAQPTAFVFSSVTSSSMNGSFTAATGADGYVVIRSTNSTLSSNPIDATTNAVGSALGGGIVVSNDATVSFTNAGLNSNTNYYYFAYSYNNSSCLGGPKYLTTTPLSASQATPYPPCVAPTSNASAMAFSAITSTSMNVSFTGAGGLDGYLVVRSTNSALSTNPVNGSAYSVGSAVGGGTVVSSGTTLNINQTSLSSNTTYYFFVFSFNNTTCTNAPAYNTIPLTGSRATDPATLSYYFGNLHSHSSYSDGNSDDPSKTPANDYNFAKTAMCMDFLGISEHNHKGAGMQLANWQPGITQATAATTSNFVALHGQEWGIIGNQGTTGDHAGHVIVYGMDSLMGWEAGNYQVNVAKSTYLPAGGLFDIINRHGNNAFATLAHPDNYDYDDILHVAFNSKADDAIVGSAVESGPAFSIDTTYTNPSTLATYAFYKNMLAKGYHLGPTVDHDNHNFTFGKTAKSRLAIMATSLSESNILDAMRKMRFYATEDCNARIGFTINATNTMGSIITKPGAPVINVTTNTSSPVTSIKIMWGVPGSGTSPNTLTSTTASTLTYTHAALANLASGYYFLDITLSNGARIITSPIWYTRDDASSRPAFVTSFFTINEADRVVLKWTAANEPVNEEYEIQRTVDGRNFVTIGIQKAKSKGGNQNTYAIEDLAPLEGLAYYRLAIKSARGVNSFSDLKPVDRSVKGEAFFVVYPNPVHDILTLKASSIMSEMGRIVVLDIAGRIIKMLPVSLSSAEQTIQMNVSELSPGSYVIKLQTSKSVQTQMVNKF